MEQTNNIPQSWNFYLTRIENQPASIRLNLALAKIAPLEQYPTHFLIEIKMNDVGESGMGTDTEYNRLCTIEDQINDITDDMPCLLVGLIRCAGTFEMYFYAENEFAFETLEAKLKAINGIEYDLKIRENDTEWDTYFDFLHPSPYEMHTIHNMHIINSLKEQGDNGQTPRDVNFWAYFETQTDAKNFSKEAQKEGFSEVYCGVLEREEEEESLPEIFQVQLCKETSLEWGIANNFCFQLMQLAEKHNGNYDGWETIVLKA